MRGGMQSSNEHHRLSIKVDYYNYDMLYVSILEFGERANAMFRTLRTTVNALEPQTGGVYDVYVVISFQFSSIGKDALCYTQSAFNIQQHFEMGSRVRH